MSDWTKLIKTYFTEANQSLASMDGKIPAQGVLVPKYGTDTTLCTATAVAISTLVELGSIDCTGYNKLLLDWKLIWANGSGTGTAYIDVYPQDIGSSPATYSKPMTSKRIAVAPVTGSPYTAMDFSDIDVIGRKSIKIYCTGSDGAALTATVAYRLVV
jgi:hypothetical protein